MTKSTVKRQKRTQDALHLVQNHVGDLDTPAKYNAAMANALRCLADKIATIKNAWVDPEVVVWLHVPGKIQAEVPLSPLK